MRFSLFPSTCLLRSSWRVMLLATLLVSTHAGAAELVVRTVVVADSKPVAAQVDTAHHAMARARITGTVEELRVSEGSEVKQGDVLAVIRDPKQPLAVTATDARLKSLDHDRAQAASDVKRFAPLVKMGAISQMKMDELNTRLSMLTSNVAALRADRDSALAQQKEGMVLAPMSGRVLKLPVTRGNVVMMGETIAELTAGEFILKIHVPERHARLLKKGLVVPIISENEDGSKQATASGKIQKIYPELHEGRMEADVAVPDLKHLYVGARMTAYVPTASRAAIYVPESAITHRYGLNYVQLKSGEEVVVETGLADAQGIEVLSGLHEGDILVVP